MPRHLASRFALGTVKRSSALGTRTAHSAVDGP